MNRDIIYLPTPHKRIRAIKHLIHITKKNLILQMYLFAGNGELKTLRPIQNPYPWARTVSDWLIKKKKEHPEIQIIVLLDTQTIENPALTHIKEPPLIRHRLEMNGILVLNASLANTFYNPQKHFPHSAKFHDVWEKNLNQKKYSKSDWAFLQNNWQTIQNVEDHRKNMVIDSGKAGIVFSHNLMDMSYLWQENTFILRNNLAVDLWKISIDSLENALALPIKFNSAENDLKDWLKKEKNNLPILIERGKSKVTCILKTGQDILEKILTEINAFRENGITEIIVASAYFSDKQTLHALIEVSKTIPVRILIDDCHALPLSFLLRFLLRNTVNLVCVDTCRKSNFVSLRIYHSTPKDMMHCKAIAFIGGKPCLIAGQANFTPNSFSGAWLETSVYTEEEKIVKQFSEQFELLWNCSVAIKRYSEFNLFDWISIRLPSFFFLFLIRVFAWLGLRY